MKSLERSLILKAELDTLRPLTEEAEQRIMQKFRLDWNYHSNNLEGNTLTFGETKALLLFNITAQGKPLKDHLEIKGHNEAILWILDLIQKERPLTESFIRELHQLILKESYEVDAITPAGQPTKKKVNVGVYKTSPNHVETKTGEIFRFATPEETPALMNDLLDWYRKKVEEAQVNPILLATEFHYKFIRIHPFDDGNGRTARILMNFILMRFGFPPIIVKTEDKKNYFAALRQADAGLLEAFVEYMVQNLNHSLDIMIRGAKGESIEEPDDVDKEIALLEQKLKQVGEPVEKTKSKESLIGIYDNSISKVINRLIEKGELLEKFYANSKLCLFTGKISEFISKEKIIEKSREKILENISSLKLEYRYQAFKHIGFNEFDFISKIRFQFNLTKYTVQNWANFELEKLYTEQLTEEEIQELINSEIRRHKEFIEKKIEAHKKDQK